MKLRLIALSLLLGVLVAACGIGYGGRVTGAGNFTPSEDWALTFINEAALTNFCILNYLGEPDEPGLCDAILSENIFGDINAGRINTNFKLTSCEVGAIEFEDLPEVRQVADGRFAISLDDGNYSGYTCDVTVDRLADPDEILGNRTLGNRLLKGTISSANLSEMLIDNSTKTDFIGDECVLLLVGGSPLGKPSILTGLPETCTGTDLDSEACDYEESEGDTILKFVGGGFLSNGNISLHSLNQKTVDKMCGT